jgi:predicted CXXCH cytochrome family protein
MTDFLASRRRLGVVLTRTGVVFACAAIATVILCGPALAWDEYVIPDPPMDFSGYCYPECHDDATGIFNGIGPHGNYSTTSGKCDMCHTIHDAPNADVQLLPGATIKGTCFTCHDGTGGRGVYGAIGARGESVGGSHSIETTTAIPGGDPLNGGAAVGTFEGPDDTLTCTDCHSPHGQGTVAPFKGERYRNANMGSPAGYVTSKLLRQQPTGASTATAVYGSDWCLGCHAGRSSTGAVHNHPVETSASAAPGTAYDYTNIAALAVDDPTGSTVTTWFTGGDFYSTANRAFLMPYPRTAEQSGHYPICQQCHEDTRYVGTLVGDGSVGDAATATITTPDGQTASDNPRFQTFPHETVGANLLVETDDDLCLNCHPTSALP